MGEDYELFAAIVEAGSLSAAARAMRISPPMASKRLARLEARLGSRLIQRTTRRLSLTSVGQRFYEDVAAVLGAARAAEERAFGHAGAVRGKLRLSAPTSFGRLHLAPYLPEFLDRYPEMELELDLSDEFKNLIGERFDLAIRVASFVDPTLAHRRLNASPRVLCATPGYLEAHGAPSRIDDLRKHHLLAATGQLPWRLDGAEGTIVVAGESRVATNSSEVVRELALAGAGIALRSLWEVEAEIANGQLERVLPEFEGSTKAAIYAVSPREERPTARVSAMSDFLAELYAPPAPWEGGRRPRQT
jgi:DNA-binding transcriptional LysR family regulator